MSVSSIKGKLIGALADLGRSALHSNFPDDIEYYSVAFELVDYKNATVDLLVFPILPSSLAMTEQPNINVKRTGGGSTTLFNTSFQPFNITMSGNFGRKFRFLIGQDSVLGASFRFNFRGAEFDTQIKSGYGTTKVLERILKGAAQTDDNQRAFKLFFHNMAFNQSHVVEPISWNFQQNDSNANMIWQYSINLRATAPSLLIRGEEASRASLKKLLSASVLQNATNVLLSTGLEAFHQAKSKLLNQ